MPAARERTRDLYEELPGSPKLPLISLPDPDDVETLERDLSGLKAHGLSYKILHAVLRGVGFRKFQQGLSEQKLENLLRRCDLRRLHPCAPTVSATVNLADDPRDLSAIERAATLVQAAWQLWAEVRSGRLAPDRYGEKTLEMGQYPNLFATSIVWERWRRNPRIFKSTDTTHINLAIGRRLYSLDIGELASELSLGALRQALSELVDYALRNPLPADEPCLGLLTCAQIDTQRKAFRLMQQKKINREMLAALRHSVLTLCLDFDHLPESDAEAAHIAHSENLCNRWHHASLQLVVFGNAKACAIFKFDACIDGNTMTRGAAELQKRAARCILPAPTVPVGTPIPAVAELSWRIDDVLFRKARSEVQQILDNQRSTFEIRSIGKQFFKSRGIAPVPAFVAALHMTLAHLTGRSVRIEQHLTLSKYRCMGLTPAVVTTPAMESFSKYVMDKEWRPEKARTLLQAAIDSQVQECRIARSHLSFSQLIALFASSLKGIRKIKAIAVVLTLRLLGIRWSSEVIVSHPSFYPETPMLGRPGVRLPYLRCFGLHYRIRDDSITVTMMPSTEWSISNAEFVAALERNLLQLKKIIGE